MKELILNNNLEAVLISINRYINIDNDRQAYAGHFESLKNVLLEELRELIPFDYLFNGWQLGGSYGDNLKVGLPDEFDMVFHITFPENSLIDVKKDRSLPGNVHLDFTRVLRKISRERKHQITLEYLKLWLNDQNYLMVEKLQSSIQSCFSKVLSNIDNRVKIGKTYAHLEYARQGPAHTLYVFGKAFENNRTRRIQYSVDFVPGILLQEHQSVIPNHVGHWEAIPKPAYNYEPDYTSFRCSFYCQEKEILQNNYNLKNVLRMMKKFRDSHSNMSKMKSYFIKTLFLLKAEQENALYWRNSLEDIIIDMFRFMEKTLKNEKLPFFWDRRLNMYDRYSSSLLYEMWCCVKNTRAVLELAAQGLTPALQDRIYEIFLISDERSTLEKARVVVYRKYVKKEPEYLETIVQILLIIFIFFLIINNSNDVKNSKEIS